MKSTKRPVKKQTSPSVSAVWWIIGLIAVIVAVGLIALTGTQKVGSINAEQFGTTLGSPDAPIKLEEYADFQCPACGVFARGTLRQIVDKYVNTNKVQIIFHHFAFVGGANGESERAAEASECANDQGKFWEYYDTLYANQGGENTGTFSDANLAKFAQQLGLDMTKFNTCMTDRTHVAKIRADTQNGSLRGVDNTPTLFINKDQKILGAISLAQFEVQIGPLLK